MRSFRKWASSLERARIEGLTEHEQKEMQERANKLIKQFVGEGAQRQVNLSNKMVQTVKKEVRGGKANSSTFVIAEMEVLNLMSHKLPAFRTSKEFQLLMDEVGEYNVDVRTKTKRIRRGGSVGNTRARGSPRPRPTDNIPMTLTERALEATWDELCDELREMCKIKTESRETRRSAHIFHFRCSPSRFPLLFIPFFVPLSFIT